MSPCRRFEQEGLLRLEQGLALDPHFATCPNCREARAAYASLRNEMARLGSGEEPPPDWMATVLALVERKERSDRTSGRTMPFWATSRSPLALAASIVVALGLGVSTLQLERQNRELESLLTARESRLGKLEAEARRLRESARLEAEPGERLLGGSPRLKDPQPNAVIFDLFSREWRERSGGGRGVADLSLPLEARSYVLILSGEGQPRAGEHTLEILDHEGRSVWRGEGLRRDPQGNFTIVLERSFLSDGEYRFLLYGKRGNELARVAEYAVRVKHQ